MGILRVSVRMVKVITAAEYLVDHYPDGNSIHCKHRQGGQSEAFSQGGNVNYQGAQVQDFQHVQYFICIKTRLKHSQQSSARSADWMIHLGLLWRLLASQIPIFSRFDSLHVVSRHWILQRRWA
ncbi:uncharacterized protein LOC144508987 [Mustelus asterias]